MAVAILRSRGGFCRVSPVVASFAILVAALPGLAGEFWETREAREWTPAEVQWLNTRSPWARRIRAEAPPEPAKPTAEFSGAPTPDSLSAAGKGINSTPASIVRIPNRRTPNAGGIAFYGEVTVRWESAAPVAAVTKVPLPPEFAGHYVLSVTGLPTQLLSTIVPQGMRPFLGTNLSVKGRPPVAAEYVFLTEDRKTLGFAIPSDQLALTMENRTAMFTVICEGLMLRSTFDLRAMKYRGRLDLARPE